MSLRCFGHTGFVDYLCNFPVEVSLLFRNFGVLSLKCLCTLWIKTAIHIIGRVFFREVFEVFAPFTRINSFLSYLNNGGGLMYTRAGV
jgi:hypothetical protein